MLQGEVLSPSKFILFISDIENYFIEHGCRGVSINGSEEIQIIRYADDYVLLADTPLELGKKLSVLHDYCQENLLIVHAKKIKIVVFTRSRNSKAKRFKKFHLAAKKSISVVKSAVGAILNNILKIGVNSWPAYVKLFQSVVLGILLYGAQIWGLNFMDVLVRV